MCQNEPEIFRALNLFSPSMLYFKNNIQIKFYHQRELEIDKKNHKITKDRITRQ